MAPLELRHRRAVRLLAALGGALFGLLAMTCGGGGAPGGTGAGEDGGASVPDGGLPFPDGGVPFPHPPGFASPSSDTFHGSFAVRDLSQCSGCHGAQLTGQGGAPSCDSCHAGWKTNCTFCHGGVDNSTGAPPADVERNTATTARGVGAHTSHVQSKLSAPIDCSACHTKPADALAAGHLGMPPAQVTVPGWDPATLSCKNACHGGFTGGNQSNAPKWTTVDGTQASCGSCHALPPATGRHPSVFGRHSFMGSNCSYCHPDANQSGITDKGKHVDGTVEVQPQGGSWNATTKTCSPGCHGPQGW